MADTSILPAPVFIPPDEALAAFRKIMKQVEKEVRTGMTLPSDSHGRQVAANTINNVFDRLEEAVEKYAAALRAAKKEDTDVGGEDRDHAGPQGDRSGSC